MSYKAKEIWFLSADQPTPQLAQAIRNFYKLWLPIHSHKEKLELFHYTTLEGLKGIVKNRSLWFTHTSSLNDPSELEYGKDLIVDILMKEKINKHEKIIDDFLQSLIDNMNMFSKVMYETYIACFCESNNLLSQWRGYAASGGGYNLGFEFTSDTKFYHTKDESSDDSYVILRKIQYLLKDQIEKVENYISSLLCYANDAIVYLNKHGGVQSHWPQMAAMESSNPFFDLMFSFKNPVFKEEKEWRLIKSRFKERKPEQIKFRENAKGVIPYLETFMFEDIEGQLFFPLRSIKLGPTHDTLSTKSALDLFIRKESVLENKITLNADGVNLSDAGYVLREK